MSAILGLFAFGIVVVIITQFVKRGSAGPNVIGNIFANIAGYLSAIN